jgi:hypothetical protein
MVSWKVRYRSVALLEVAMAVSCGGQAGKSHEDGTEAGPVGDAGAGNASATGGGRAAEEPSGGSSAGGSATGGAASSHSSAASSYPIDPAALEGCRTPDEPGCQRCCERVSTTAVCYFRAAIQSEDAWEMYGSEDGPCPGDCPRCAQCDVTSEEQLNSVTKLRFVECDCSRIDVGEDPCIGEDSCECDCSIVLGAMEACPMAPAEP